MKKGKKLQLSKVTIQNLNTILDRDEQKEIQGGTDVAPLGTTVIPVICNP